MPTDYKTQEHDHRGAATTARAGTSSSRSSTASSTTASTVAVDELLHAQRARHVAAAARQRAQEVEPQRFVARPAVGLGGAARASPRASSPTASTSMGGGLKPTATQRAADRRRLPRHGAELVDVRRRHQDDDGHGVAELDAAGQASTRASTTSYYDKAEQLDADLATRPAAWVPTARRPAAAAARRSTASARWPRPRTSGTRRTRSASTLNYRIDAAPEAARRLSLARASTATLEPAPQTDDTRLWLEYRNTQLRRR